MELNLKIKEVHFVEFVYPSAFIEEHSYEQVNSRDANSVTIPYNAFAYRFFDRTFAEINGEVLRGEKRNFSPYTYLGVEYTLKELKEKFPHSNEIINRVERCQNCRAIRTRVDTWAFINNAEDKVVSNY